MATSSGTEVGVEVEEEVEYVEEVVEYEDEEVLEEEEEEEEEVDSGKQQKSSGTADATVKTERSSSPAQSFDEAPKDGQQETAPRIPPSSTAQELSIDSAKSSLAQAGDSEEATATAQTAAEQSEPSQSAGAGVDLDFKQLEAQAAKVAKEVSHLALDVSSKLTAGLRSAFGGAEQASAGAGASLTKLAGGLTSWWGSLDPAPTPARDETAELVASANKARCCGRAGSEASGELQQLFGLSAEENLVEHFKCKLLQTYSCNHNSHTPAIQLAFQGTLYVTDRHTCYCVEERGRKAPFKVPHSLVVKATRQRPARKGDLSDVLKLDLSNGQWLSFKDFDSGSALDSALALVEHLTDSS
ncbi:hypothetical protein VOLCADRAFT_106042 [Volvox carteri f. nagariensis]|uniref:GRAM domain-containing protein n=1 Tax=Volvox carteri f. nagariensis TaxID=3068 RepID=D8U4Q3_VOLCA|nr:uncharacterized protein VOLCADRAFT_106042 [Volvox carteri f. nagariensis]EFJ45228.1 hypothetical protein VOLCADRAFT_106042 [Volvox carteri f. nagariensis]|eukprot:XP_002953604.1 hypothetical protein VOLCADRAFT_106042 [Volvox carteri f. nagariensis]